MCHLDVHLENGQRIYFEPENVVERVGNPRNRPTTLMAFFNLSREDEFAKTLLYEEVSSRKAPFTEGKKAAQ